MIEVTPQDRAQWAEQLANRPGRLGTVSDDDAEPETFDEWTLGGTQVFAIASGKGGVGKSTITTNLAATLAGRGLSVGILDADLNGYSIPRMLGVVSKAEKQGEQISAGISHGVKVISLGMFVGSEDAVVWRGPVMNRALEQLIGETDWGDLDVLLVDLPPGTGDIAISIAKLLPQAEIVIVTTPQLASAEVAARAGAMTKHTHQRVRGVVENMSWFDLPDGARVTPFGSGGGALVASKLTAQLGEPIPLLAQIPLADEVRAGADAGNPVTTGAPETAAARALAHLAGLLVEGI